MTLQITEERLKQEVAIIVLSVLETMHSYPELFKQTMAQEKHKNNFSFNYADKIIDLLIEKNKHMEVIQHYQ